MTTRTPPPLHLTQGEIMTLASMQNRCRAWLTAFKRARKYRARRGSNFTEREADILRTLLDLERATGNLLEAAGGDRPGSLEDPRQHCGE